MTDVAIAKTGSSAVEGDLGPPGPATGQGVDTTLTAAVVELAGKAAEQGQGRRGVFGGLRGRDPCEDPDACAAWLARSSRNCFRICPSWWSSGARASDEAGSGPGW